MAKFRGEYYEILYRIYTHAVYLMACCYYGHICGRLPSPICTNNSFVGIVL